jgi:hypothetical protein
LPTGAPFPKENGMTAQIERTERRPGPAVIQGKLAIPPLAGWRVERPRLDRSLAALLERHRVVVVSATAGAGKTSADWLPPRPVRTVGHAPPESAASRP